MKRFISLLLISLIFVSFSSIAVNAIELLPPITVPVIDPERSKEKPIGGGKTNNMFGEVIDGNNEFSKYPLEAYQLDSSSDNITHTITNAVWMISVYLSSATGYVVQETYSFDIISDTVNEIGKNIQNIAGVNQNGFMWNHGFYGGFLLIFIFILGIYFTYVGLIKRETTKAIKAVVNFVVVLIVSVGFIAYASSYIGLINDFSADISSSALKIGTSIVMPNASNNGTDSTTALRENLWGLQVKQPWLLLQYNTSDVDSIGEERIDELLSTEYNSERKKIAKREVDDYDNYNMSSDMAGARLGMVILILVLNVCISVFVLLLLSIVIFSQILFIIYAMFLPISFLLSMLPTFEGTAKKAIMKLFNVIMTRAIITLVITVAFSISTMLYSFSSDYAFFLIMILQVVTFGGIYIKLGDVMSMASLNISDSQSASKQIVSKPVRNMKRGARKISRMILHKRHHKGQRQYSNKDKQINRSDNRQPNKRQVDGSSSTPNVAEKRSISIKNPENKDKKYISPDIHKRHKPKKQENKNNSNSSSTSKKDTNKEINKNANKNTNKSINKEANKKRKNLANKRRNRPLVNDKREKYLNDKEAKFQSQVNVEL